MKPYYEDEAVTIFHADFREMTGTVDAPDLAPLMSWV